MKIHAINCPECGTWLQWPAWQVPTGLEQHFRVVHPGKPVPSYPSV